MSQCQRSGSKCQKLRITSIVIVTDIPIKPHQFPTSSFWVARHSFFAVVTLTLDPRPWNCTSLDILKMYLHTENEVARLSHSSLSWKMRIQLSRSKVKVKCHQFSVSCRVHHGTYSYQVTFFADRQTHRQTPSKTISARSVAKARVKIVSGI